eukprot:TRINITY_DN6125_c0_g1_i3.p1 TRINITY_DN6125_c0_g1~~TRINITY_DN6125_c0_g1_i3.p1  ORF type:complete len:209 (+),score=27.64 TRINITY_DN6125_c0_g1_i3:92-718(+)
MDPTLYGKRVVLKPFSDDPQQREEQLLLVVKFYEDPKSNSFLPFLKGFSTNQLDARIRYKQEKGGFTLLVVEKDTDQIVGVSGLNYLNSENRSTEFGVYLSSSSHGKGYGTECLEIILKYAIEEKNVHRFVLKTDPNNIGMRKASERVGMKLECIMEDNEFWEGKYFSSAIYVMISSRYYARIDANSKKEQKNTFYYIKIRMAKIQLH